MFAKVKSFFAAVPGALSGYINSQELFRAVVTGLAAGPTVGFAVGILTSVSQHASTIFAAPSESALAVSLIAVVLDLLRRQTHGIHVNYDPDKVE